MPTSLGDTWISFLRFALPLQNESNGVMNSQTDDHDDKSWLRVPLTDPVAVANRYDEWAPSYDDELHAWGYEAPVQAARLLVAQLRARPHPAATQLQ